MPKGRALWKPPSMPDDSGKWITFEHFGSTGKTHVWNVLAKDEYVRLGEIRWFARWRAYAFFPAPNLVFEKTCLRDIAAFCESQNTAHRRRKAGEP